MQKGHQGGPSEAFEYDERLCDANIPRVIPPRCAARGYEGEIASGVRQVQEDNGGRWFKL